MSAPKWSAYSIGRFTHLNDRPAPLVPILRNNHLHGWPGHEQGERVYYAPLSEALTRRWRADVHTAAYSMPSIKRRLDSGAPAWIAGGVVMQLAIFDVDGPDHVADGAWWENMVHATAQLRTDTQALVYRTRGGCRIVLELPAPILIVDDSDAAAWSKLYRAWLRHLSRRYNIVADALVDWTRLFRLPRVIRDGKPTVSEIVTPTFGGCGWWSPELTADDLAVEADDPLPTAPPRARDTPFAVARDAWCAAHPVSFPRQSAECPVCLDPKASFRRLPKVADRWCCWSSRHSAVGKQGRMCWYGDALDLECHRRGLSAIEVLRADGYLVRK